MLRLIVRRVLLMLSTAIAVSALLFFTVTQLLGSPAEMMLGQDASPQAIAALNAAYGFDQPAVHAVPALAGRRADRRSGPQLHHAAERCRRDRGSAFR